MAFYKGRLGHMSYDGTAVIQISDWKIDSSVDILDGTSLQDVFKRKIANLVDWKGSFSMFLDMALPKHKDIFDAMIAGQVIAHGTLGADGLSFFLDGTPPSTGKHFYGDVIITGFSVSTAVGDLIKAAVTFEGSDDLHYSAT